MSAINLDKIFYPKSIAVVGTGQLGGHIFSTLVHNLIDGGYSGEIYPVHPDYKSIWKRRACPSLFDINSQVDLAVLSEPYTSASKIIKDCIETGVKGLVIISGGKEYNKQERDLEIAAINEAKHSGLRIIGPDCHGIICSSSKLNVSFLNHTPIPGKMAFISQSGAIFSSVFDLSIKESVGFSHFINIGSMPDVNFGDIIDYLGKDYDVSSIVIYAESFRRIRNFMSAARAVSRIKPIIVLKSGRTKAGALAAASHTGNLAGEDGVYDAAFERAGIVRVKTFEELFDCAELLAKQPRPLKPQLAIITNSGGLGVMAVDALSDYGVEPVTLKDETIKKLDGCLPPGWNHTNPVDILGDASPERYKNAVDACLKDSQVKGLLIILSPQVMFRPTEVAESLVGFLKRKPYPIFTCWLGGSRMDHGREIFNRTEIPTFDSPERAVRAFMDLYRYSKNLEILQQIPSKLPGKLEFNHEKADKLIQKELLKENLLLTSKKAKDLINSYGIPVGRLKKTVSDKKAKPKILRFELSAGSKCDRDFGPVILFGLGGVMAEVMEDQAVALPPLNRLLARKLMEKTKIYRLVKSCLNCPSDSITQLEEILIRLAQLVTDFPEIEEIDINPLMVTQDGIYAENSSIILKHPRVSAPHHMVISPYPNRHETRIVSEGIGKIFIRPILPEDSQLLVHLFESLSKQSVYFRFFSSLRQLPHSMIARFTQIDYDREIALVALLEPETNEKMIGVARVITDIYNHKQAEFSVAVGDPWQGKGIGAALLKRCLLIAKERGLETVGGFVLPENIQMLALGKKLGFSVKSVPGEGDYKLNIDLTKL